jgi:hypothetical protein
MLLGFKKRFVDPILIGTKVFSLRKRRKVRPKIGEAMHMYTALRTKYCQLITNKEKLMSIQDARVTIRRKNTAGYDIRIWIDRRRLSELEISQFVIYDGFTDRKDFAEYWLTDERGKKKNRTGALLEQYHWTDLTY